ncbi:MAG: RNA methyltransferase [Leptolyngbyaceae cyanobacterium MO_188.B28]|nr:RNA methyltransferase [Leptolyngbyaceae cyanobacterium MO_188.B28]
MPNSQLENVRIVLVEPAGPLNIGSVARVMKNMGLRRLVLVNPQCDPLGAEARQMAVHGVELLESAQTVAIIPDALQGCQRAMATTARLRTPETRLETPEDALPWLLSNATENEQSDRPIQFQSALIFGPEDRGLSSRELNYAQRFIQIPANPVYPSLNLAQAVAVCAYVLYRSAQGSIFETALNPPESGLSTSKSEPQTPDKHSLTADLEHLEGYYQHLEAILLKIGYLYPHTAESRMEKFRRLLHRAAPSEQEVAMLRGILRQVEWALDSAVQSSADSAVQ